MNPATIVKLADVEGAPSAVKLDLPYTIRLGDRLKLNFRLQRKNGGRSEVLTVQGDFRVASVTLDTSETPPRQILSVESTGKAPCWQAVKNRPEPPRRLAPARFPPTALA